MLPINIIHVEIEHARYSLAIALEYSSKSRKGFVIRRFAKIDRSLQDIILIQNTRIARFDLFLN